MQRLIEHISTRDGASVACKRKPSAGQPVIFMHGLAVNADIWDIPDIRGNDFLFRSLASQLHECGCDVWLANLRGHGGPHMLSRPPEGQTDWCVDHFVLFDLPAVVEHVARTTGQRPILIGSSMGAMTIAAYLEGAVLVGYGADQSIVADEAAARQRQKLVAGAILIEFPAALRWPRSFYDERGEPRWMDLLRSAGGADADRNYPFEWLSRIGWIQLVLERIGQIPLDWLRPAGSADRADANVVLRSTDSTRGLIEKIKLQGMKFFSEHFKGSSSFCAETFLDGLLHAVDHMKAGVLRQLARSVRARGFVSALGTPDHVYSDHYDQIDTPTLVIAGGRDCIASADVTREAFYDRIRSTDKQFLLFDDIAHGEFEYAPVACQQVYPRIVEWIETRAQNPLSGPAARGQGEGQPF